MFKKLYIIISLVSIFCLFGCTSSYENTNFSASEANTALNEADIIVIQKDLVNFEDHWEVYADNIHVADINGEFIKIWDVYAMRSTNGELMASEEEQFSVFLNKANRVDINEEIIGFYEQNISLLFFDMTYKDNDSNVIAK